MKPAFCIFVSCLVSLPLVAQINSPKIGTARYPDGSFHTVQGLPANMIVADLPLDSAQAASFSDNGGLVQQDGVIRLLAANFSTVAEFHAAETALVSIDGDLTSALAWLPKSHSLLHWNGSSFESFGITESDIEGTVTDLQSAGAKQARLIVRHSDNSVSGVTISLRNGNLVSSEPLPGVHGYAFGQGIFLVYTADQQLVVDSLRGYRRSVELSAPDIVIERMSNNWLHLYSPSLRQNWALHLTRSDLQLSLLPGLPNLQPVSNVASSLQRAQ
jgi:hypothetical protein